jgi:uncharacterized protein (DUF433 family)
MEKVTSRSLSSSVLFRPGAASTLQPKLMRSGTRSVTHGIADIIDSLMVALEETLSVPLTVTEHGTIRVKGSRVSLDSIVHHFKLGATAEQIAQSFPSLNLGDIYAAIAYYLAHREAVEEYLEQQEAEADALQEQMESDPKYQSSIRELRSRILSRWSERHLCV